MCVSVSVSISVSIYLCVLVSMYLYVSASLCDCMPLICMPVCTHASTQHNLSNSKSSVEDRKPACFYFHVCKCSAQITARWRTKWPGILTQTKQQGVLGRKGSRGWAGQEELPTGYLMVCLFSPWEEDTASTAQGLLSNQCSGIIPSSVEGTRQCQESNWAWSHVQ